MTEPLFDGMKRTVNRNLLKYAAGSAVFCPGCGAVMDWRLTVLVARADISKTMCTTCYDTKVKPTLDARADRDTFDVTDGRDWK